MPEGDTIFRAATAVRKAIGGAEVTAFRSDVPAVQAALAKHGPLEGKRVTLVEARGKWMVIQFDDGRALLSHMRMEGSWHIYRAGEPWRRSERQARAVIETPKMVAVVFNAPIVELVTERGLKAHASLTRLGPDATTDTFDEAEARRRIRGYPERTIGELLLTQSAIAGVGNVIKSEVLFICRQDPFARVRDVPDPQLAKLVATSHRLLVRNRVGGSRTTRESLDGKRLWVYGRSGDPCRLCGTAIEMIRQGLAARSTYFCPSCQGATKRRTRPLPAGRKTS